MTAETGAFTDDELEAARVLFAHEVKFMMGAVQMAGEASDPAEHLERFEVQVGALALPRVDDAVDFVVCGHPPIILCRTHLKEILTEPVSAAGCRPGMGQYSLRWDVSAGWVPRLAELDGAVFVTEHSALV